MSLNMIVSLFNALQPAAQAAAETFVSSLWQGCLIAAAVALTLKMLPRTSGALRFAIWTAAFLVLASLPLAHLLPQSHPMVPMANLPASKPLLQLNIRWSLAILAVWVTASLYRLAILAVHCLRLYRLWTSATPVPNADYSALSFLSRPVQVCTTRDLDRPSVIGFFTPRILIPENLFAALSPADLQQVLLHESEHLHRRDDWTNLLQKLSLVLFPLNPALLWIERRLCFEREMACDEGVIQITKAPRAYATCLTHLAERNLRQRRQALALGAWQRRSELVHRVHSILLRRPNLSPVAARALAILMIAGLFAGATELSHSPQLVAFVAPGSFSAPTSPNLQASAHQARIMPVSLAATRKHSGTNNLQPARKSRQAVSPASAYTQTQFESLLSLPDAPAPQPEAWNTSSFQAQPGTTPEQGWVVLTTWQQSESDDYGQPAYQPTLVKLVFTVRSPKPQTYAAVPTRNGWLLIQL